MKTLCLAVLAFTLIVSGGAPPAFAQFTTFADNPPPAYDLKSHALLDLQHLQKDFIDLAQAIPAEKYTWRPAPGVRSISELFLHVAAGNFGLTAAMGVPPAPGFKREGYDTSTTDKSKVIEELNRSFEYTRTSIENLSNTDLQKPVKIPGDANVGDVVYHLIVHVHEHLGQSVSYARSNGVAPPWTVAQQQPPPRPSQD